MAGTTTCMSRLTFLLMAGSLLALASPAGAVTAKFYNGGTTYSGPFSGAGTVYAATSSSTTDCPGGAVSCPTDIVSASQSFVSGPGITATSSTSSVWDDLAPDYGGLGVGTGSPSDTDQIADSDLLKLTFGSKVVLTGIATLFTSGHESFGPGFDHVSDVTEGSAIAFGVSVDGATPIAVDFDDANNMALIAVLPAGTSFEFSWLTGNPTYYVSALTYAVCGEGINCSTDLVPIPGALPLFASGLGGLGLLGWRRRKRKTAAA
jgi:hypothetical protein